MEIRPYTSADAAGMRDLMVAVYPESAPSEAVWQWRHLGLDAAVSRPMLVSDGDRIVASQPLEAYRFVLSGRPITGVVFTDGVVHPDFRGRGLFLDLLRASQTEAWDLGADFVTTMPNDRSHPAFLKIGWTDPGLRTLLVRPLRPEGLAGRVVRNAWARRLLTWIVRAGMWTVRPSRPPTGFQGTQIVSFPQEADGLVAPFAACYPGLHQAKDAAWLTWRYERTAPGFDYRRIAVRRASGDLAGVGVVRTEARSGLSVGYIMDILADSREATRFVVEELSHTLETLGADLAVAVVSHPVVVEDLLRQGFVAVPARLPVKRFRTVYLPRPGREDDLASLASIRGWHQMLGDWDNL